jgi:hypothetical protein
MSTSKSFVLVALVAAFACSSPSDSDRKAREANALGSLCIGPACLGQHVETLRLGPPAPPVIPSRPLGPPITLPLGAQSPGPTPAASAGKFLTSATAVAPPPPPGCSSYSLDMKVLVIATDGQEADLQAIQQASCAAQCSPLLPRFARLIPMR